MLIGLSVGDQCNALLQLDQVLPQEQLITAVFIGGSSIVIALTLERAVLGLSAAQLPVRLALSLLQGLGTLIRVVSSARLRGHHRFQVLNS